MKLPSDTRYTEELLVEAMQMLENLRGKLAMFDKSRYYYLKKKFDNYMALDERLRKSLNEIETEE